MCNDCLVFRRENEEVLIAERIKAFFSVITLLQNTSEIISFTWLIVLIYKV